MKKLFVAFAFAILALSLYAGNARAVIVSSADFPSPKGGWLDSANPTTFNSAGDNIFLGADSIGGTRNYSWIITFNVSDGAIPDYSEIQSAELMVFVVGTGAGRGSTDFSNETCYGVDNQTWIANSMSYNEAYHFWNNASNNVTLIAWNDTFSYLGGSYEKWNVTSWVQWIYSQNRDNITFYVNHTINTTATNWFAYLTQRSRNYATVNQRPTLNITYKAIDRANDMQFINPTSANNSNISNSTIFINISTNSSQTHTCLLEVSNETGVMNLTMTIQAGAIGGFDACGIALNNGEGWLSVKAFANNTPLAQGNQSGVLNLTIDRTQPTIAVNSPANKSLLIGLWSMINLSVNDTHLDIDGVKIQNATGNTTITNTTFPYYYINTSIFGAGEFTATFLVWVNDSASNANYTSLQYAIDSNKPQFYGLLPSGNTSRQGGGGADTYLLFSSWVDNDIATNLLTVYLEFGPWGSFTNYTTTYTGGQFEKTFVGLPLGMKYYRWCGTDTVGAVNCSDLFQYNITEAGGGFSGPGGGGGGGGWCGDHSCKFPETAATCPTDCINFTFRLIPTVFNNPGVAGQSITCLGEQRGCSIDVENPNSISVTMKATIEKAEDESYSWASFTDTNTSTTGFTLAALSTSKVGVIVNIPSNFDKDFQGTKHFRIAFNSGGTVQYVDYYVTFGGLIGIINAIIAPLFSSFSLGAFEIFGYQVAFVGIIAIIIIAMLYSRGGKRR